MSEEEAEECLNIIEEAVAKLGEHFDSVQVFVTRHDSGDDTSAFTSGNGNWYARVGVVDEWLTRANERNRTSERSRGIGKNEDTDSE